MRLLTKFKRLRPPHRVLFAVILFGWVIVFVVFSSYTQRKARVGDADGTALTDENSVNSVRDTYYTRDVRWLVSSNGFNRNYKVRKKILLVTRSPPNERFKLFHVLCKLLDGFRAPYEVTRVEDKAFVDLKNALRPTVVTGRYAAIVFVDVLVYLDLKDNVKEYINDYSKKFNTGILYFATNYVGFMREFDLDVRKPLKEKGPLYHKVNRTSTLLRITKDGGQIEKPRVPKGLGTRWMYLSYDAARFPYETVSYVLPGPRTKKRRSVRSAPFERASVVLDPGKRDGIKRVFFAGGFPFFLSTMLFMDALDYVSPITLMFSLERYLQVDVDDIFIGSAGIRIQRKDVTDMLTVQSMVEQKIPGFKFNLGFSGKGYYRGNDDEDDGDDAILEYAHRFTWFGHLYDHEQAHKLSLKALVRSMKINKKFAKEHGIPLNTSYAVAPHHSGVYPVHEALFTAWRRVHRVSVTSTEEYPHLKPAWLRRGFIYRGIKVLPRQTCGLFTSTITFKQVKGGSRALDRNIHGGELFETLLRNPIMIIMTHMTNYANDRLAQYLVTSMVNFVDTWTNIELRSATPSHMADIYFKLFPQDKSPLWLSPCDDPKRHLVIWDKEKSCAKFPSFLLIGPPHGGLELLQSLIHLNPDILHMRSNTSQEIEFFSSDNYMKGIDWYMDQFPAPSNPNQMSYEPSVNYFTSTVAPRRANALLKAAKIVFVLEDPVVIAYAQYQHLKRLDKVVDSNFDDLVTSSTTPELERTRQAILRPGHFAEHIGRWMKFFDPKQMLIVNLRDLVSQPVAVMRDLQDFLALDHPLDYEKHLRFNKTLNAYCHVLPNNATGACYVNESSAPKSDLDASTIKYLQRYYAKHNHNLMRINQKIQFKLPKWLKNIG